MMKVINNKVILLSILFLLLPFFSITAKADIVESGYCGAEADGKNIQWTYEDGVLTFSGSGKMADFKDIHMYWNDDKTLVSDMITKVVVEDGITNVGANAVWNADNMTELILPDSIEKIGDGAFANATALEEVDLPANLQYIGDGAFFSAKSIKELVVPDKVTTIKSRAFNCCDNLKKVTIPNSVTAIGQNAFTYCDKLKTVNIDCENIGDYAFASCEGITKINFGEHVKKIGLAAFRGCQKLSSLTIPNTIVYIGEEAFGGCSSLVELVIPDTVITIGGGAFKNCENLERLTLPSGLTSIEDYTFEGCGKLKELNIPSGVTTIGNKAFLQYGGEQLVLPPNLTSIGDDAFIYSTIHEIVFPDTLKKIGNNAFAECNYLTDIILPDSIMSVGTNSINAERIVLPWSLSDIEENAFNKDCIIYCSTQNQIEYCKENEYLFVNMTDEMDISDQDISAEKDEYIHTGTEIEPKYTVIYHGENGDILLKEGFDYEIEYSDNVNVGDAKAIIRGLNLWNGTVQKTFKIRADITRCNISLSEDNILYDGTEKKPDVILSYEDSELTIDQDYTIEYKDNIEEGTATITISGIDNYIGTVTRCFTIYKLDIQEAEIELSYVATLCDGSAKEPSVMVTHNGNVLAQDVDYILEFADNIMPGKAIVSVIGKNQYSGVIEKEYKIIARSIKNADVSLEEEIYYYDNKAKTPLAVVVVDGKTLVNGIDYSVSYEDNINCGTAYVIIYGKGIYGDYFIKSFKILPCDHVHDDIIADEAIAPTCTKTGLTEGSHCSVCGEIIKAQEIVEALGHTVVTDEAIAPTCTKTGLTEGSHCSVCGEIIKEQEIVEALGHTVVTDEAIAPTCTKTGLTEGSHCSVCGEIIKAREIAEALGHTVVTDEAIVPTCTKTGMTEGSHCSVCGEVIKPQETVEKIEHNYNNGIVTKAATEKEEGIRTFTCSVCGESYTEIIPKIETTVNDNNNGNSDNNHNLDKDKEIKEVKNTDTTGQNKEQEVVSDETIVEAKDVGETIVTSAGSYEVTVTGDEPETAFLGMQNEAKVIIPDTITVDGVTYEVTSISSDAFKNNKKLKNVIIGSNIEEIGKSAFSGCKSLTKITIKSKQIESIGDNAFANCTSLTSVTIPTGVEVIGKNAFSGCKKLKKVIIKSTTITKIGKNALKDIKKNAKIKCPKKQYDKYRKLLKSSKVAKTVKIKK